MTAGARYAGNSTVIGFDLRDEPHTPTAFTVNGNRLPPDPPAPPGSRAPAAAGRTRPGRPSTSL